MTSLPIVARFWRTWRQMYSPQPQRAPDLHTLWQQPDRQPLWVQGSPIAQRYIQLLGPLDWGHFPERDLTPQRGMPATPFAPFVAACLVKLDQQLMYFTHLHTYLCEHPALAWACGFPLLIHPTPPGREAIHASLPTPRHFPRLLHKIPNASLQCLLTDTVRLLHTTLQDSAPDFGQTIALDTKHILAWVKENNPKAYVKERYVKDKPPTADPDCRLGCKRKRNQRASQSAAPPTPQANPVPARTLAIGEFYWGYASGIVTTKVPDWGELVLAELTLPFDQPDVAYFFPLLADTEQRLGFRPACGALDAAFDAWYIYEYFHRAEQPWQTAFAAVPLAQRGAHSAFADNDLPLCKAGLPMPVKSKFFSKKVRVPHERAHYGCPLQFPERTADSCPIQDKHWDNGGCITTLPTSIGTRLRHRIDRDSDRYHQVYNQRTATERLFSLATALGIERPKLRNGPAIANWNTLIYILLNLRALQRIQAQKVAQNQAA